MHLTMVDGTPAADMHSKRLALQESFSSVRRRRFPLGIWSNRGLADPSITSRESERPSSRNAAINLLPSSTRTTYLEKKANLKFDQLHGSESLLRRDSTRTHKTYGHQGRIRKCLAMYGNGKPTAGKHE